MEFTEVKQINNVYFSLNLNSFIARFAYAEVRMKLEKKDKMVEIIFLKKNKQCFLYSFEMFDIFYELITLLLTKTISSVA